MWLLENHRPFTNRVQTWQRRVLNVNFKVNKRSDALIRVNRNLIGCTREAAENRASHALCDWLVRSEGVVQLVTTSDLTFGDVALRQKSWIAIFYYCRSKCVIGSGSPSVNHMSLDWYDFEIYPMPNLHPWTCWITFLIVSYLALKILIAIFRSRMHYSNQFKGALPNPRGWNACYRCR